MCNYLFNTDTHTYKELVSVSLSCSEMWNMALIQRRNKYSWGKANAQTQIAEIQALKQLEPSFEPIANSVLAQVFLDLEAAYAAFLAENQAFKRHKRDTQPTPPQPVKENFSYPQHYNLEHMTQNKQTLTLLDKFTLKTTDDAPVFASGIWVYPTVEKQIVAVYTENPLQLLLES